jgi:hypothetical protein
VSVTKRPDRRQRRGAQIQALRKLGITDARAWVDDDRTSETAQVARAVFLQSAWSAVIPESRGWLKAWRRADTPTPDAPFAQAGPALRRLLAAGIDPDDLTDVVRALQVDLLFQVCELLDSVHGWQHKPTAPARWVLVETDADGNVGRALDGLHEDVTAFDPTGREMRPRPTASRDAGDAPGRHRRPRPAARVRGR